ncbi:MAG: GtrA family protein [bacterium]|nr:GtrA family protein [bacterium]
MVKKDYIYAAIIGLVTAFFASLLVTYGDISREFGGFVIPLWSLFVVLPIGEYVAYVIASRLFSHIIALKQMGRFAIVGLMNFTVDAGILTYLTSTNASYDGATLLLFNVISVSIAIVNSYFWQRGWTFKETDAPSRKEFLIFVAVTIMGIVINTAILFLMIEYAPRDSFNQQQFVVVAKVAATLVSLFWNFFGYKLIVFKDNTPQTNP